MKTEIYEPIWLVDSDISSIELLLAEEPMRGKLSVNFATDAAIFEGDRHILDFDCACVEKTDDGAFLTIYEDFGSCLFAFKNPELR